MNERSRVKEMSSLSLSISPRENKKDWCCLRITLEWIMTKSALPSLSQICDKLKQIIYSLLFTQYVLFYFTINYSNSSIINFTASLWYLLFIYNYIYCKTVFLYYNLSYSCVLFSRIFHRHKIMSNTFLPSRSMPYQRGRSPYIGICSGCRLLGGGTTDYYARGARRKQRTSILLDISFSSASFPSRYAYSKSNCNLPCTIVLSCVSRGFQYTRGNIAIYRDVRRAGSREICPIRVTEKYA